MRILGVRTSILRRAVATGFTLLLVCVTSLRRAGAVLPSYLGRLRIVRVRAWAFRGHPSLASALILSSLASLYRFFGEV